MTLLFSSLVGGVTKKMFTNIIKVATIYSCIRETTDKMFEEKEDEEANDAPGFMVKAEDVEAAYSFVKQSMITFRCFKVSFISVRL